MPNDGSADFTFFMQVDWCQSNLVVHVGWYDGIKVDNLKDGNNFFFRSELSYQHVDPCNEI